VHLVHLTRERRMTVDGRRICNCTAPGLYNPVGTHRVAEFERFADSSCKVLLKQK